MNPIMKTIVVGIGNPILGDDGVGIHISRELQKNKHFSSDVTVEEAQTGGMNLLDLISGFDHAILVDAVSLNGCTHGEINRYDLSDLPTVHSQNPHDVSLSEAISLTKALGHSSVPKKIIIIGVNLKQIPREFTETISPEIQACIPQAVDLILSELKRLTEQDSVNMNT